LTFDPSATAELCAELDDWQDRLDYKGPLPRAWQGRLGRDLEVEAVAASTIMEGVPVTVEEVRRILAGDPTVATPTEDRRLVEGYKEAMNFVLRRADDPAFAWNSELLIGLHDRVLGGSYAAGAGRFRTGQRSVVNSSTGDLVFLPPPAEQVPDLVAEVCRQMQGADDHPAVAAAWIHVAVAAIHPFSDGNGRSARILASLAMHRGGFKRREFTSLEEWWGRHLREYYDAFRSLGPRYDPSTDVTSFIRAHVGAQVSQVRALDLREQVERRIWTVIEDMVEAAGLHRRVANAVWDAFFGREVTAGYYRSVADVSPATATNDLTAAVAGGFLSAKGQRKARRYLPGPDLYVRVGQALNVDVAGLDEVAARSTIVGTLSRRISEGTQKSPDLSR
jgi:Fic family protein